MMNDSMIDWSRLFYCEQVADLQRRLMSEELMSV